MAGSVALLLWATRMVRTGVERAYGAALKRRLRRTLSRPFAAALTGLALAVALQSSTAVTLLVGSFAGSGIVTGLAGILAVRGAEVGSALVVRLLSFDLTLLVPICLTAGTTVFLATERREWRQLGRILVGIGLLVLSLDLMAAASAPLRDSAALPLVLGYLAADPVTAFLVAALMTWAFHSSIAAVLLLVTLAATGVLPAELGVVMVLGVNLGSSVIAPLLTRGAAPAYRVVPLANLLMRGAGSILCLALLVAFQPDMAFLGAGAADRIVHAHILFNVLVLFAGIPLSGLVLRASEALVALRGEPKSVPDGPPIGLALDAGALDNPDQALSNVAREVLRLCDRVEIMLARIVDLYDRADQRSIDELAALDDLVDRHHGAIKLYLARITRHAMTEEEAARCQALLDACIKLEQVGDIIVRNMLAHVQKKMDRRLDFTEEGWSELSDFHASVLANARLAFNLLVTLDAGSARQLVIEKDRLREVEKEASRRHFERLRSGTERSVETSSIHLDTIRDLKQINSLLAALAYPVLEQHGLLSATRLKAV
jgi:phosphate:Na+ symporter